MSGMTRDDVEHAFHVGIGDQGVEREVRGTEEAGRQLAEYARAIEHAGGGFIRVLRRWGVDPTWENALDTSYDGRRWHTDPSRSVGRPLRWEGSDDPAMPRLVRHSVHREPARRPTGGASGDRFGARAVDHRGGVVWEKTGSSVKGLMDAADREAPKSKARSVVIREDYTSDGTYWGSGHGRVVASREGGGGRGPGGWIVEGYDVHHGAVNRAGRPRGPRVVDDRVVVAADPKWHFGVAGPRLVFEVTTWVTGSSQDDARRRAERYGNVSDTSIIQLAKGYVSQSIARREEPSIEAVERTTTDATSYLARGATPEDVRLDRRAWLRSLRKRPSPPRQIKVSTAEWADFLHPERRLDRAGVARNAANGGERTRRSVLGGAPEVIHRMRYGGTRYKYDNGVSIDHVEEDGLFHAWQAGNPTVRLGEAGTLQEAEEIAVQTADLSTAWVHRNRSTSRAKRGGKRVPHYECSCCPRESPADAERCACGAPLREQDLVDYEETVERAPASRVRS